MAATAAAVRAFNGDRELGTVADIDNHYAHLDQAALPRDCALVELDGRVVAYGRASWAELADGGAQVEGILNIRPDARGRGVEELLAGHAVRRARELAADPGLARGRPADLRVFVSGRDEVQRAVLAGLAFRIVGHGAGLIRPDFEAIPDIPLPEPFEVRPIDPGDRVMHRRVCEAAARAFADSAGEEKPTEEKYQEFLDDPSFAPTLWQVAFDGDRDRRPDPQLPRRPRAGRDPHRLDGGHLGPAGVPASGPGASAPRPEPPHRPRCRSDVRRARRRPPEPEPCRSTCTRAWATGS